MNPNNIDPDVWLGNYPDNIDKLENPDSGIGPIERPVVEPPVAYANSWHAEREWRGAVSGRE